MGSSGFRFSAPSALWTETKARWMAEISLERIEARSEISLIRARRARDEALLADFRAALISSWRIASSASFSYAVI